MDESAIEPSEIVSNFPSGEASTHQIKSMLHLQHMLFSLAIASFLAVNLAWLLIALLNPDSPSGIAAFFLFAIAIWMAHLVLSLYYAHRVAKVNGWSRKDLKRVTIFIVISGFPLIGVFGPLLALRRLLDDAYKMRLPMKGSRIDRRAAGQGEVA